MKRQNTLFIIITMLILISIQLHANTYVLIIGNGDYVDNSIRDLPGALEDMRRMKETLILLEMANEKNIRVIKNLPGKNLEIEIKEFLKKEYDKDDRLIFYYSGHGYSEGKQMYTNTYLVPTNTIESYREDFLINFTKILKENLNIIKNRETLIFLDSCYSGSILKDPDKSIDIISIKPVSLLEMIKETNVNVMVASGAKEVAKEEVGKGGYFTKYLIEGLKGKANEDSNEFIDFGELGEYVRKNVVFASNDKQQPEYSGNEELIIAEVKEQIIENIYLELLEKKRQEKITEKDFTIYTNILTQPEDKDTLTEQKIRASLMKYYRDDRRYDETDLLSLEALIYMMFQTITMDEVTEKDLQRETPEGDQFEKPTLQEKPQETNQEEGTCYLKLTAANEKAKNASIYIDNIFKGTLETGTLLIERLEKTTHIITVDGEKTEREDIEITFENDWMMLTQEIKAQMAKRKLLIITDPPGATVKFNGTEQNEQTPVMIEVIIEEDNSLILTKDGYIQKELTIREERKGEPKRIETLLEKNQPPTVPINTSQNEKEIKKEITLQWESTDPEGDAVAYDFYFGKKELKLLAENTQQTEYFINDLDYDTQYLWKVIAKDQFNSQTSPLWTFKTSKEPTICTNTYEVFPDDVTIYLDGKKQNNKKIILTKGRHQVVFERIGYQKETFTYNITLEEIEKGDKRETITLEKKDVIFEILTNPEKAKIIIDDNWHYYSPYRSTAEWGKTINFKVEKDGYQTVEFVKNFQDKDTAAVQAIPIELKKLPTRLILDSTEPETEYFLNGEKITNDATIICWGKQYEVTAIKQGFKTETKQLMLSGYPEEHRVKFDLEKEKVALEIKTVPEKTSIYLDGNYENAGSCQREIEWGVPLEIIVQKQGYEPLRKEIIPKIEDISKGILLQINLKKQTLSRQILSNPENAMVSINGERVGKTPLSYDFTWGEPYQITLEKAGYITQTQSVAFNNTVKDINFYLEKQETALSITSEQENVSIKINNQELGKTPVTYNLIWGQTYIIEASKEGYEDYTKQLIPELKDAGKTLEERIQLGKKETVIKIDADISETEVFLDGESIGVTPLQIAKIWGEKHSLTFKKKGYQEHQQELDLAQFSRSIEKKAFLQKKTIPITVQVFPEDASIIINEQKMGRNSVPFWSVWGQLIRLKVEKEGYEIIQKTIIPEISDIEKGIHVQVNLEKKVLERTIQANPKNANVIINERAAGETPLTAAFVWGDEYRITVEKGGYMPQSTKVICDDSLTDIVFELEKKEAELLLQSEEEDVTLEINDKLLGTAPLRHNVKWGETYTIVARKEGYYDYKSVRKPGLADVGKILEEKIKMEKKETLVKIDANVNETKVCLDGEYLGVTPLEIKKVWGKTHSLSFKKDGYEESKQTLNLTDYTPQIEKTAYMKKKTIPLTIDSNPQSASVFIDNKKLGTTPFKADLEWGSKKITIVKTGYYNVEKVEMIEKNQIGQEIEFDYELEEREINLKIDTTPANANVYINDRFCFKSPSTVPVKSGEYTIEIKKEQYENQREKIYISKADLYRDIEKNYPLEKVQYDLTIISTPTADIFIESVYKGMTPSTLQMPWGEYNYQLKKQGYETLTKSFTLKDNLTLSEELEPIPVTVHIESSVTEAEVYINNESVGKTPLSHDLLAGTYNLRIKKEGFETIYDEIVINESEGGTKKILDFESIELPAILEIQSNVTSPIIYLDGKQQSRTRIETVPGTYWLQVEKEGYIKYGEKIELQAGKTKKIIAELNQRKNILQVVVPVGINVYIDGVYAGWAPLNKLIENGSYNVELLFSNNRVYYSKEHQFEDGTKVVIENGQAKESRMYEEETGTLEIKTIPDDANVYLNNAFVGKTPFVETLEIGLYDMKITKEGYDSYTKNKIILEKNKVYGITKTLEPRKAKIYVNGNPSGASIYVDGNYKGTIPKLVEVLEGNRIVEVKQSGYATDKRTITITEDDYKTIYLSLKEQKGILTVSTNPSGASIYLNNDYKGKGPKTIENIEAGTYTVKVTKYGYEDKIQSVSIQGGKTENVNLTLEKEKGKPILKDLYTVDWKGNKKSDFDEDDSGVAYAFEFTNWTETHEIMGKWYKPNGSLYHSGSSFKYEKTSNGNLSRHWIGYEFEEKENVLNIMKVNPGRWKVEVYLDDDYLDTVYFTFGIAEEKGSLYISTNPSGALIYIDGIFKGTTPKTIEKIEPGTYNLKLDKSGYEDKTKSVKIIADERETLYITLEKEVESSYTSGRYVPEQVLVKAGTFKMGNTRDDERGFSLEKPVHTVELTYDFYIGKYEVTFDEFDLFCDDTGLSEPRDEDWGRGNRPVIYVSWQDAIDYCNWLSKRDGLKIAYDSSGFLLDKDGNRTTDITQVEGYRLPTESEWEYAARGGHKNDEDFKFAGSDDINAVAWYKNNSNMKSQKVGQKKPNELGIYDMSGNVYEWCYDGFEEYTGSKLINPIGPSGFHSDRIIRGGSFYYGDGVSRISYRFYHNHFLRSSFGMGQPNIGFRIAKTKHLSPQ